MINKIFSNSERVTEPAGFAGRGVAQVRGGVARVKGGVGGVGGAVAGCGALLFFYPLKRNKSSSRLLEKVQIMQPRNKEEKALF